MQKHLWHVHGTVLVVHLGSWKQYHSLSFIPYPQAPLAETSHSSKAVTTPRFHLAWWAWLYITGTRIQNTLTHIWKGKWIFHCTTYFTQPFKVVIYLYKRHALNPSVLSCGRYLASTQFYYYLLLHTPRPVSHEAVQVPVSLTLKSEKITRKFLLIITIF